MLQYIFKYSSFCLGKNKKDSCHEWTENEVRLLLASYKEKDEQFSNGKLTDRVFWAIMVSRLKEKGYMVTSADCKSKMMELKRTYKDVKDANSQTGNGATTCQFYNVSFE